MNTTEIIKPGDTIINKNLDGNSILRFVDTFNTLYNFRWEYEGRGGYLSKDKKEVDENYVKIGNRFAE